MQLEGIDVIFTLPHTILMKAHVKKIINRLFFSRLNCLQQKVR